MQDLSLMYIGKDWDKVVYPVSESFKRLHIVISNPIAKNNTNELVEFTNRYENISILFKHCIDEVYDLSILESFPGLERFSMSAYDFTDFEQFSFIPTGIKSLRIDASKSLKLSLSFISKFLNLKSLALEKHKKDIEALSDLNNLQELNIRSITMPDLSFIGNLNTLKKLGIRLGGTKNLELLPSYNSLESIELWEINKISNIDSIADIRSLKSINLDQLSIIEDVKSLKDLINLKHISLCRMKRLKSLKWLADAPNLEEFIITQTSHLDKEAFIPLTKNKTLRAANIYIGKKNTFEVRKMLDLPEIKYN